MSMTYIYDDITSSYVWFKYIMISGLLMSVAYIYYDFRSPYVYGIYLCSYDIRYPYV